MPKKKVTPTNNKTTSVELKNLVMDACDDTTSIERNGVSISIKKYLSMPQILMLADDAVSLCFDDDGNYIPAVKDFAIKYAVLNAYTDINLPTDSKLCYDLIHRCGDLYDTVIASADTTQFSSAMCAINEGIRYKIDVNTSTAMRKVNDLLSSLSAIEQQFATLFNGVSNESISSVVQAISNSKLDEEKLVRAILDNKTVGGSAK